MANYLASKSKRIAIAAALGLGLAGTATIALARGADTPSADTAAASSNSAGSAPAAAKGSATAAAPDPSSPVVVELKELREAVEAQAKQFEEHSQQLDAERAALKDEFARIASRFIRVGPERQCGRFHALLDTGDPGANSSGYVKQDRQPRR
jgi:hypothetical protein